MVRHGVAVIVIPGSVRAVRVAKAETKTIPIVFMNASDPVQAGVVASYSRPGGNVTGITDMGGELTAKRLGLLHELLPGAKRFAALIGSNSAVIEELQTAAAAMALEIEIVRARSSQEIDTAFETVVQG
jgi:putative tryptophan/tyrosine transport system substrate-binding protein